MLLLKIEAGRTLEKIARVYRLVGDEMKAVQMLAAVRNMSLRKIKHLLEGDGG